MNKYNFSIPKIIIEKILKTIIIILIATQDFDHYVGNSPFFYGGQRYVS